MKSSEINLAQRNQSGAIDPETGQVVALFHPVGELWHEHFAWSDDGLTIIGTTPTGRATVVALDLNDSMLRARRAMWIELGFRPPDWTRLPSPEV